MIPIGDTLERISQEWQQSTPDSEPPSFGMPCGNLVIHGVAQDHQKPKGQIGKQKEYSAYETLGVYLGEETILDGKDDQVSCLIDQYHRSTGVSSTVGSEPLYRSPSTEGRGPLNKRAIKFQERDIALTQHIMPREEDEISPLPLIQDPQLQFEGVDSSRSTDISRKESDMCNPAKSRGRPAAAVTPQQSSSSNYGNQKEKAPRKLRRAVSRNHQVSECLSLRQSYSILLELSSLFERPARLRFEWPSPIYCECNHDFLSFLVSRKRFKSAIVPLRKNPASSQICHKRLQDQFDALSPFTSLYPKVACLLVTLALQGCITVNS